MITNTKKLTEMALLTTAALIIFIVELHIPNLIPIPGVKPGLANIITVYAVYHYSAKDSAIILLVRIILGTIFSGNMMSLSYSLAGGFLCLVGMLLLRRVIEEKYIWVCSVLGAVLHNVGQITVAVIITGTVSIAMYFPFLLISGCIAGLLTGLCAQGVTLKMKTIK